MKALIIGATGATGKDLVNILLQDPQYTEVVIFVRRPSGKSNPKLTEIITDFNKLEEVAEQIRGDVWFSCLGTTLATAGSTTKQWQIDYDIPVKFAEIAKRNGIENLVLISSYGASSASRVFYSKMKGQLEEKLDSLGFKSYTIFRPGLLLRRDTDRVVERLSAGVLKLLNSLGITRRFRPMPTSILAEKMAKAPRVLGEGKHVIELEKIFDF